MPHVQSNLFNLISLGSINIPTKFTNHICWNYLKRFSMEYLSYSLIVSRLPPGLSNIKFQAYIRQEKHWFSSLSKCCLLYLPPMCFKSYLYGRLKCTSLKAHVNHLELQFFTLTNLANQCTLSRYREGNHLDKAVQQVDCILYIGIWVCW